MRQFRDFNLVKEDLRSAVDLVDYISRYDIDLKQRGERWIGFCPFHKDVNNPGFAVSPNSIYEPSESKGVWACWSCQARGDLYAFVQRMHDATFIEAISIIAEAIEFDLTPYYRDLTQEEALKEIQYQVVEEVADRLCDQLLATPRKLKQFAERGITEETLRKFKVGYSPSLAFFNESVSAEVRNVIEPRRWNRERLFDNRIVYAQFTVMGKVWGWSSRQPDDRPSDVPKYIVVSEDAPLFDGYARLYGFYHARQMLRKSQYPLILVEGFNDVLASQQAGYPAAAVCGNQLSKKQEDVLRDHSIREAIVAFDADEGGRDGQLGLAMKAHNIKDVRLRFASLRMEPEELIAEFGGESLGIELSEAMYPINYLIHENEGLINGPNGKREFLNRVTPYLRNYPRRSIDRAFGIQTVAEITNLSSDSISDFLDEQTENPLVNIPGEGIILATLACDPIAWTTLDVQAEDFSMRRYRSVFLLMQELYESEAEVNVELLHSHAMNNHAPSEVIETISKLSSIQRKNPDIFARDIRDKAIRRKAETFAETMGHQVRDLQSPVLDTVAGLMDDVTRTMNGNSKRIVYSSAEAIDLTNRELERRAKSGGVIAGLDAGPDWEWLMLMLNGFMPQRTTGVGAFSNVGKSVVLTNWIHKLSVAEEFTLKDGTIKAAPRAAGFIVSMEMPMEDVNMRLASIDSGVPHSLIDHARMNDEQQAEVVYSSLDRIRSAPLSWMYGQRSIREIAMQARILQAKGALDYIALDYIQLLDLTQYPDRWSVTEKYNQASQDMTALAKSLSVPIIYCAQLNRNAAEDDVPRGDRIGQAIKIYQDTDNFYILADRENGLHGSLDKNRSSGKGHCKLFFDHNTQTSTLRIHETEVLPVSRR